VPDSLSGRRACGPGAAAARGLGSARVCRLAALLWLLGAALAPALAEPRDERNREAFPKAAGEATEDEAALVRYEVSFTGVEDAALLEVLRGSSQLLQLIGRPPASLNAVERRAQGDLERLSTALRSEGYYASSVDYLLDSNVSPVRIEITVASGPLYHLTDYDIVYQGTVPEEPPELAAFDIVLGMPARAPPLQASQDRLLDRLAQRGHPFAEVIDREVLVFAEDSSMTVTLTLDAGPRAHFGPVRVKGLEKVEEDYVRRLIPWQEGDRYDRRKVEEARRALSETRLFAGVAVKPAKRAEADGSLPMTLALSEAAHRSLGFGANYSTDVGIGGEVFWEHRNLFGEGEGLRAELIGSEIEQSANLGLRKPNFLRLRQALLADFTVARRDTDAFEERSVAAFAGMEAPLGEHWLVSGGGSAEYLDLEDNDDDDDTERLVLFGVPLTAVRDDRDDFLNPTRGTRLALAVTPYAGTGDSTPTFVASTLGGSAYYAMDSEGRYVLAGRAKLGSLVGEATDDVPANKRFYVGGGGSVRGYEFQSIGPRDDDDDPLGGRSLIEVGAEVRLQLTDTIGVVPFVDGGTVYDASYPDFDETFRWAAGLGLRYFTGFGPVRVDFAIPVNKRDDDDSFQFYIFQFYISFGQAF
jgi:translocation and assembly module TamA